MCKQARIGGVNAQDDVTEGDRSVLPTQPPRPLRSFAQEEVLFSPSVAKEGGEQQAKESPGPRPHNLRQPAETQSSTSEITSVLISHISSIA
jgi:hypothetical protein